MSGNDLLDKMALIDPTYIEAADVQPKKRIPVWIKLGAMAACLALAFLASRMQPISPAIPLLPDLTSPAIQTEIVTEPYWLGIANTPNNQEILGDKPLVSGYEEYALPVDMSVSGGGVCYSPSLEKAMEIHGDAVNYRVLIELFSNGVQIPSGSAIAVSEFQRLSDLGYIVALETVIDSEIQNGLSVATATYYFTLHATYEQLKNFQPSSELGYSIMLYNEHFDNPLRFDTEIYNDIPSEQNPIAPFDEEFTEPPCYDEEPISN